MKLKTRIKRALAAFLREELLEYIGYKHNSPLHSTSSFVVEDIPFDTLTMEKTINLAGMNDERGQYMLEDEIQRAKKVFAHQVMDHIHVDARELLHPEYRYQKFITLKLRVQRKQ